MTDTTTDSQVMTAVNLVRSSHPWTKADSAAGFVLRYLIPMRRQLIDIVGTPETADKALKLLLGHLVSTGFGQHKQGRLRDFLLRAIRSAAKATAAEMPEAERPTLRLDDVKIDSKTWIAYWREGLLQRAWRSLERFEHAHRESPVYSVLSVATAQPAAGPSVWAAKIRDGHRREIDAGGVENWLPTARTMFAQYIADEVAETLEHPDKERVGEEITRLGLGKAFEGVKY